MSCSGMSTPSPRPSPSTAPTAAVVIHTVHQLRHLVLALVDAHHFQRRLQLRYVNGAWRGAEGGNRIRYSLLEIRRGAHVNVYTGL